MAAGPLPRPADARLLVSVAAGVALVGVVGFLVVANFRSARTLRENLLHQRAQQVQLRAATVGHLLASAEERLRNLAGSREVAAFHESRDLGMSMAYGLGLTLVPIGERLRALAGEPSHGAPPAFDRVAMFDESGAILADSAGGVPGPPVPPGAQGEVVRLAGDGQGLALVIQHTFKGRPAGAFVGWLRAAPLREALGPTSGAGAARLLDAAGRPWLGTGGAAGLTPWPALASLGPGGQVVELEPTSGERLVAARVRIPAYPLSLEQVDRAEALLGRLSPALSALSLSVAVLLVLAAAAAAVLLNTRALVLEARLEESLRREREVEEKHRALEAEAAARQRLEQAQALLARAVDQAGEAIAVTDAHGRFSYVNPAFERITLWPAAEILGQRPIEAAPDTFDGAAGEALRAALRQDRPWKGELLGRRRDGAALILELVVSPVHDAAGATVSHVTVARDVSEERRLLEQLRHAQKLEAVGTLAGGVAHDFNNLLAVISGNAGAARLELPEGHPVRQDLDEILQAARRAADLTRQLLAFGRRQALAPRVVDLNEAMAAVEKMLRRLLREDVELATAPGQGPLLVQVDPGQLDQILMNLVVNARDALPAGGHVSISSAAIRLDAAAARSHPDATPGDWVRLRVRDDGAGMDQETLRHVFEPFFTTKEVGKGTGLGLSVIYGIVRQSRGFIEVASQPGQGATIDVYLPAAAAAEMPEAAPAPADQPAPPSPEGRTVLVVEDEPQLLRLLQARLGAAGFEVLAASHGQEALELAANHQGRIDLLLTDVVMPHLGGPELAERFGVLRPEALVVFMSGHADEAVDPKGLIRRAAAFVQKPDGLAEVPALLSRLLDRAPTR